MIITIDGPAGSGKSTVAAALALRLGLPLIGTLGILLAAKRRTLIPRVREPIDTLRRGGFRVANDLYEDILHKAGELA